MKSLPRKDAMRVICLTKKSWRLNENTPTMKKRKKPKGRESFKTDENEIVPMEKTFHLEAMTWRTEKSRTKPPKWGGVNEVVAGVRGEVQR